jgi:hypothetical protein
LGVDPVLGQRPDDWKSHDQRSITRVAGSFAGL